MKAGSITDKPLSGGRDGGTVKTAAGLPCSRRTSTCLLPSRRASTSLLRLLSCPSSQPRPPALPLTPLAPCPDPIAAHPNMFMCIRSSVVHVRSSTFDHLLTSSMFNAACRHHRHRRHCLLPAMCASCHVYFLHPFTPRIPRPKGLPVGGRPLRRKRRRPGDLFVRPGVRDSIMELFHTDVARRWWAARCTFSLIDHGFVDDVVWFRGASWI